MTSFHRVADSALYVADTSGSNGDWWGFVITRDLPEGDELPAGPIALQDALENLTWQGSFVYVAEGPGPGPDGSFIGDVRSLVERSSIGKLGAIIFLETGVLPADPQTFVLLNRSAGTVSLGGGPGLQVNLTGVNGFSLSINPNSSLAVGDGGSGEFIELSNPSQPVATLTGAHRPAPVSPPSNSAQLHFAGSASGTFTFPLTLEQRSLHDDTNWGFQLLIPNDQPEAQAAAASGDGPTEFVAAWFPLAERGAPGAVLGFSAQVSVVNPRNRIATASPTALFFDGRGSDLTLVSGYRTNYGKKVTLTPVVGGSAPARLVINAGYSLTSSDPGGQKGFRLAPAGDFAMSVDGAQPNEARQLLCGLSGTETIAFTPHLTSPAQQGSVLRFHPNLAGNIPEFPLKAASPIGPPVTADAQLLDDRFETSWVSIVAPPSATAHYTAAPKGAELFGISQQKSADGTTDLVPSGLLGPKDPGLGLHESIVFPMVPLAGFRAGSGDQDLSSAQLAQVAREILGPTRKAAITASTATVTAASALANGDELSAHAAVADGLESTTTPTGFITRYGLTSGKWEQLLLAQVQGDHEDPKKVTRQMGFNGLDDSLQAAFQTSDQFLVVANADHLGAPVPHPPPKDPTTPYGFMPPYNPPSTPPEGFYNTVNIGKWNFAAEVGQHNQFGDYRSVMIVKGVKGRILDIDPSTRRPTDHSLVMSPDKWTMTKEFATPDSTGPPQLGALSNWLVDYCLDAWEQANPTDPGAVPDPYFVNFAKIVQDPNWTGVLILKATIRDVPPELAGILAGVKDPTDFFAHHIGIEIGQIDKDKVQQTDTTSMFGLIHYIDPRYDDRQGPHAIAPSDLDATYDFTLLTLKALFENSSIKKFDSLAQMVLNQIFGSQVASMVDIKPSEPPAPNRYNAVLLEGGVQRNGEAVVYSLASRWPNRYTLRNNVLTTVEIDTAQMSTRDDGATSGQIVSWIGMTGYMNFSIVPPVTGAEPKDNLPAFDIFSFGPDPDKEGELRSGLNFSNLGLQITIPPESGGTQPATELVLLETEMSFNTSASHPRDASIYKSFQLELLGLLSGNANAEDPGDKSDPASLGYLPAVTQYGLRGVTSGAGGWHGLNFKLNLGTPGALAGKVNLDSSLLVAWADDSGAAAGSTDLQAMVAIELPGAGSGGDLFSLQTVIKLSIGLIQLIYVPPTTAEDGADKKGGFLLVLNEIALKLLGLLKIPPSGNTAFLLFGDPDAADSTGLGWFAIFNKAKKAAEKAAG